MLSSNLCLHQMVYPPDCPEECTMWSSCQSNSHTDRRFIRLSEPSMRNPKHWKGETQVQGRQVLTEILAVDEQMKEGNRKTSEGSTLSVNVLFHSMSVQRSINCFPLPKPNIRSNLWRLIHKMDSLASWTSAWLATWIASCSVWQTLLVSWSTSTVRNLVR